MDRQHGNTGNHSALRQAEQAPAHHLLIQEIEMMRVNRKMTQEQLAALAGMSRSWWKMALARRRITFELDRIDRMLNVFGYELAIAPRRDEDQSAVQILDTSMEDERDV